MRITFDWVYNYLELNIKHKYDESSELLDSIILSYAECSEIELNHEYNLDFFMIYEKNTQIYFNRVRNVILKVLNFPLKIPKLSDTCGNFLYSLITFTHSIISLVNEVDLNGHNDENENDSFHYKEILSQITKTIFLLGNWKNLSPNIIDAKCPYKDKSSIESVHAVCLHMLLSTQNILFYLVHFLTQKMLANNQLYLTENFELLSFSNDELSKDECSLFIQHSYLIVNNLIYLHLNAFKKNVNLKNPQASVSSVMPCECIAKSWFLICCLTQTYDKNGYLSRIQQIFWTSLTRITSCLKNSKKVQASNRESMTSNKICISPEIKSEDLNHFIILLNNEISTSIRIFNEKKSIIQASDYLDLSFQLLRNTLKEILDKNQGTGQLSYSRLLAPLHILCMKFEPSNKTNIMPQLTLGSNSSAAQKIMVDIMILLWESYFSKYMNSTFNIYNNEDNSNVSCITSSLTQTNDFKMMLRISDIEICSHKINVFEENSDNYSQNKFVNIYHLFLKYLFLNLKESNQSASTGSTSAAWRTFKGRLYTRLHDKRISELDLTGIVNLAYLFFVLIKSFSSSSLQMSQLRFDQMENFYRILNVFIQSKNLEKLDSILSLTSTQPANDKIAAKTNALKIIMNARFTSLKLWFQADESKEANQLIENEAEIKEIVVQEFSDFINKWIVEALDLFKAGALTSSNTPELKFGNQSIINPNQIMSYKNSQITNQFLCDMILNYLENCRLFLFQPGDESYASIPVLQKLLSISSEMISDIKFGELFRVISRKQFEVVCLKITEIISIFKDLIRNQLSSFAYNTALSNNLTDLTLNFWNALIENRQNSSHTLNVFSYEIVSKCYFELCSFYSYLFFNPGTLLVNSTKKMKTLLDMIEKISFPSYAQTDQNTDTCHSNIVRLKFINSTLTNERLFDICNKHLLKFQSKLVSFLIYVYLNNTNTMESTASSLQMSNQSSGNNLVDVELNNFLKNSIGKITIFNELDIRKYANPENFIIEFIKKYAVRLNKSESFADKKLELENFAIYFQDFLKLTNSMQSISSHAIIYKCYLVASQIVLFMSVHLHGRGRSDTIFAKIIDKMVLPYGMMKSNSLKASSNNNLIQANNQNSILISLKDTLHMFLTGISNLNYEYDGYLQRVLQSIVVNFSMKFQMLQFDDHFLTLALESTFTSEPSEDIIRFRTFLFRSLKNAIFVDLKPHADLERYLTLLNHFLSKTNSTEMIKEDVKLHFCSILLLLGNENNSIKTKALSLFNFYMRTTKKFITNEMEQDSQDDKQNYMVYTKAIEDLIKTYWHQVEPNKIFISLSLIARHNKQLMTSNIKYLILQKVEETPSKFRFNTELKNTLYTLFELLDGDQGKVYLNNHLSHILNY